MKYPKYKKILRKEINKYEFATMAELKLLVNNCVPPGIKDEDIFFEFETEQYSGYYDETLHDLFLNIYIVE